MKLFSLKVLSAVSFVASLACGGAYAAPPAGTYQITVNIKAVDGSAPPAVSYSATTGSTGQQWVWNGSKFRNVQTGAVLADNGNGAPTENSTGDAFKLLAAGSGWNIVDARTGNYLGIFNGALSFNLNAAGTWSLGTTTCFGSNAVLLNGSQAAGGCGKELLVDQGGNIFVADANGYWWEWVNGGWTSLNTMTTP
jgi:hypothetical protein